MEDLDGLGRDDVVAFLQTAADDEIRTQVRALGVPTVLATVFTGLAARFDPDPGRGEARLRFVLTDGADRHVHDLLVGPRGGAVATEDGPPRATITVDLVRFLKIGVGAADAARSLLTRRMKVSGDLVWAGRTMAGLRGAHE